MRIAVAGSSGLIGSQVCRLAEAAGHEVVRLSRTDGVDLLDADAVARALAGVEAVVDVTRPNRMDLASAREFFTTVAHNLAVAGRRAGVRRTVVLSIVGVVLTPPVLIASIYGMNFHNMPELSLPWGYPMALGLMLLSAVGPYLLFKLRGWL